MSSLYLRRHHLLLHGIFNTSFPATPTSLLSRRTYLPLSPTSPSSSRSPSSRAYPPPSTPKSHAIYGNIGRSSAMKLIEEPDLRTLVNKFKKYSEIKWFRKEQTLYVETVRRLAAAKQFSWIEEILEEQKKYKNITDEGFVVRMIGLYGKSGMFDHARKLFDEMPQLECKRTVMSFNALLAACVNAKKLDTVEEIFREVTAKLSIKPDALTYSTVVRVLCEMGSLDSVLSLVVEMENNGVSLNSVTYSMILEGLYQNGRLLDGYKIWKLMENKGIAPCIRSYNAKLQGLLYQKRMTEAVDLFEGLWTKGLKPNNFTFNFLIEGFCNDKNLEEAKRWYNELAKSDCTPNRKTFEMLVPFVYEMADFGFALELCKEAIARRCVPKAVNLQNLVDGLVRESKFEEAKKFVESIQQSVDCDLTLPSDE